MGHGVHSWKFGGSSNHLMVKVWGETQRQTELEAVVAEDRDYLYLTCL